MMYKVIIVGGGASGIISAIECAKKFGSDNVCILESNDRIGKKLIATGNGRGNLSNVDLSLSHYHGDTELVEHALKVFDSEKFEKYFNDSGIMLTEEDGKIYPMSFQASSVLDMLMYKLKSSGVVVKTGCKVKSVKKRDNVFETICENGQCYTAENLVMATGGKSGGHFGTDGNGFDLLKPFGHTITQLSPSLVKLKCDTKRFNNLRGIKVGAKVTLLSDGKEIKAATGDLLFTENGVSGNTVFSLSSYITDVKKTTLQIDFIPNVGKKEFISFLQEKKKNCPYLTGEDLLTGIIHKQVGKVIYKLANGDILKSADYAKRMEIKIDDTVGFADSQVTKGGVKAIEINPRTFESKLISGLYIAGEMLNVDGDCGGYNLHFAFASGYTIAQDVK